jgi:hypothetical protein
VSSVVAWLAGRSPPPPATLRERMDRSIRAVAGDDADASPAAYPTILADAGIACLRAALELGDGREAALDLLAADALLTYAYEAAAGIGDEAVARLNEDLSPARFAALLDTPAP